MELPRDRNGLKASAHAHDQEPDPTATSGDAEDAILFLRSGRLRCGLFPAEQTRARLPPRRLDRAGRRKRNGGAHSHLLLLWVYAKGHPEGDRRNWRLDRRRSNLDGSEEGKLRL